LFTKRNLENACFLLFKDEIIGAIFCTYREINIKQCSFQAACLGGIFINEVHRGRGLFSPFLNKALAHLKKDNTDIFLLWSENESIYKKFKFRPVGTTYYEHQVSSSQKDISNFKRKSISEINNKELFQLKKIYETDKVISNFKRSQEDWDDIKKISSIDIFIHYDSQKKIESYFLKNKGMDLNGIIHEFTNDPATNAAIERQPKITPFKPLNKKFSIIPSALVKIVSNKNISEIENLYCNGVDGV